METHSERGSGMIRGWKFGVFQLYVPWLSCSGGRGVTEMVRGNGKWVTKFSMSPSWEIQTLSWGKPCSCHLVWKARMSKEDWMSFGNGVQTLV